MKPKKMPGSPEEWLNHARSDLRLAQLAATDKLVRREQACFHAQQAAEKAIKAVLVLRGIEFPLTHDIEELLEIADTSGISAPREIQEAGLLTPYAVEFRYPGSWIEISETDTQEALKTADLVVTWAETTLTKSGGGSK
jgi:HEPN domain-containing protein